MKKDDLIGAKEKEADAKLLNVNTAI